MTKGEILDYFKDINVAYNNPNKLDDLKRMLDELCEEKTSTWIVVSEPDENDNIRCICSNCGQLDVHAKNQKVPYCWWCGAKMEVEECNL